MWTADGQRSAPVLRTTVARCERRGVAQRQVTLVRVRSLARQRLATASCRLVLVPPRTHATLWGLTCPMRRRKPACVFSGADLAERLTGRRFRRAGDERVGRPVRGPRPLGIELPGARALTPSSASRRAGPRRSAAARANAIASYTWLRAETAWSRCAVAPSRSWWQRCTQASPRRSCSWSGRGVPATGPAQRVRQPWRLR